MMGPLFLLVSAQNAKFGAFTDKGLDKIGGWRKSKNSYLFGINENIPIICPIIPEYDT